MNRGAPVPSSISLRESGGRSLRRCVLQLRCSTPSHPVLCHHLPCHPTSLLPPSPLPLSHLTWTRGTSFSSPTAQAALLPTVTPASKASTGSTRQLKRQIGLVQPEARLGAKSKENNKFSMLLSQPFPSKLRHLQPRSVWSAPGTELQEQTLTMC